MEKRLLGFPKRQLGDFISAFAPQHSNVPAASASAWSSNPAPPLPSLPLQPTHTRGPMATIDAEQQQQVTAVVPETVVTTTETTVTAMVVDSLAPASPSASTTTTTTDPAAVAISKRAAKKMKKSKSAQQQQLTDSTGSAKKSDKDEEENANNIATIDHPYLSFLHKRIRLYKKKLEKIKSLETARSEEGKVLNVQQLELVATKFAMEKIVTEFESLREQFIEVYLQEEATKKAEQEKLAAEAALVAANAAASASVPEVVLVEEIIVEPTPLPEAVEPAPVDANQDANQDAFVHVQDLLKTLHVVNLHQALGKDIPMVLDFFSKVLLGNTRPVAEISFEDNLAESLDEAKKYLQRSDKIMACDSTYRDLREIVDKLSQLDVLAEVVESPEETPAAEKLPEINFFTDSLLDSELAEEIEVDNQVLDDATDDKSDEHAGAPEEIEDVVEEEEVHFVEEIVTEVVIETAAPSPASIPIPPMSFAAAAASTPVNPPTGIPSAWANRDHSQSAPVSTNSIDDKNSQRRRPQGARYKNNNSISNNNNDGVKAEGNYSNGDKPRRSRPQRSNEENPAPRSNSYNNNNRAGQKDDRRPRVDRALRKQGSAIHQPHSHASPQA